MAVIKTVVHANEFTGNVPNNFYPTPELNGRLMLEGIIGRPERREMANATHCSPTSRHTIGFLDLYLTGFQTW
jgi:hypothetical protein